MNGFFISLPEQPFGWKFWQDVASQAVGGIIGATIGALAGATLAFHFERKKSIADRQSEDLRVRQAEDRRRAAAGNMAMMALAQIYMDLWNFRNQFINPVRNSPLRWYLMLPTTLHVSRLHRFDVPSLEFLFRSALPAMPLHLSIEEARFETVVDLVNGRARIHEGDLQRGMEAKGIRTQTDIDQITEAAGPRVLGALQRMTDQIVDFVDSGVETSFALSTQLRTVLNQTIPDERIIAFTEAQDAATEATVGSGSRPHL